MANVVLGVTGCIGAYKACEVLRELQKRDVDVRVVMTAHAAHFVSAMTFEALSRHPVFLDQFALGEASDIQHVSLADSAELLLVAPATANILGKFANGIADDALSTLYTATRAPVLVAPAMNVNMFEHPAVVRNMETLRARGVAFVDPGSGYLACGWLGKGRLAEGPAIVETAMAMLARRHDLEGETVLVTAGPTVEDLDPVRFVSNRSTGRMGYRLAEVARDRGVRVILVSGPTSLPTPPGVEFVGVRSAEEMARAVGEHGAAASIVAMAAAVSDYRPATVAPGKLKKTEGDLSLEMVRTSDILRGLGAAKGSRFLMGFAAETESLRENARKKRAEKNLDLIVANDVSRDGSGFASDLSAAVLIDARGESEVPLASKRELAERIWDRVVELREKFVSDLVEDAKEYARFFGRLTSLGAPLVAAPEPGAAPVAPPASGDPETELKGVREELGDCQRCKLAKGRKNIVFGQGNPSARLMFVGEAPGADEDEQGLAFVGRAGQLLTDIIEKGLKIPRSEVFIANVLKCRPPGNRNPEPDEILSCQPFLDRQIAAIRPKVIVGLGKFAGQWLLKTAEPISRIRGRVGERDGIKVIPTFHPAYLLRNPSAKKDVWEDMKTVLVLLNE